MTTHSDAPGDLTTRAPRPARRRRHRRRSGTQPPPRRRFERWQHSYAAVVRGVDIALLVLCTGAGTVLAGGSVPITTWSQPGLVVGIVTAVLVCGALALGRAWEPRVLGNGAEELRRLVRAVGASDVVLAVGGLALRAESVRLWVFVVLPAYTVLALVCRYGLRRWLHHERRHARCMLPVLAVGGHAAVSDLIARTRRDPHLGWTVTGVCTSTGAGPDGGPDVDGVPVVGDLESVSGAVRRTGYRLIAVAPGPGWGPRRLHELAWQLEGTHTELVVDPDLMEVAGPRLHVTPVEDMPLVRLTRPQLSGGGRLLKDVLDRAGAAVLLLALAPLLLGAALAVLVDGGPVLRRQERVGAYGRTFGMARFRIARKDNDRRLTRTGRILRRWSLEELPQLFHVLAGTMSLVGPRPPLLAEVRADGIDPGRTLLGRPGMTGLWQVVPGQTDLSWEESVRLDLRYVENWSVLLDLTILWKTLQAVLRGRPG